MKARPTDGLPNRLSGTLDAMLETAGAVFPTRGVICDADKACVQPLDSAFPSAPCEGGCVERVLGLSWVASTDGVQEVGSGSGIAGWETVLDNFRSIVEHLVPGSRLGSPVAGMRRIGRWIWTRIRERQAEAWSRLVFQEQLRVRVPDMS